MSFQNPPRQYSDSSAIISLIARYGLRFTSLDVERAGIPEQHARAAVTYGLARVERVRVNPITQVANVTYLVLP